MDNNLQQALAVFVKELTKTFTTLKDYSIEQFPSVVQEFMQYEAIRLETWFWVWLVVTIIFFVITILLLLSVIEAGGFFVFLFLTLIFAFLTINTHLQQVKLKTAPKVYILEKMMDLTKY